MDTYCLVNETQETAYRGVERWSLDDSELRLLLMDEAATELGATELRIKLTSTADAVTVRAALESILA